MNDFNYEIHHLNLALNELTQKINRIDDEKQKQTLLKLKKETFRLLDMLEDY